MSTYQYNKRIRASFFQFFCKSHIALNGRRTGIKHKQHSFSFFFLNNFQRLFFIQLLCRSIQKADVMSMLLRVQSGIYQPQRIIQGSTFSNSGTTGFSREFTKFGFKGRIDKIDLHNSINILQYF